MNVHPFNEAEKVASHNVARACALTEVSRSAYYEQCDGQPSERETSDAELTERIIDIHTTSKGRYGAPRIHATLRRRGYRAEASRVVDASSRAARAETEAVAQDDRARPVGDRSAGHPAALPSGRTPTSPGPPIGPNPCGPDHIPTDSVDALLSI